MKHILKTLKFLFYLVSPIIFLIGILIIMILFYNIYYYKKGLRKEKYDVNYKKRSKLKRIFIDFPRQFVLDSYNRDPYEFCEFGLHMFCGEQGSGKTVSVVDYLIKLKSKYPKCKIRTNMDYKNEDGKIEHWKDIVSNENGLYGQVEVLDEIQTWFSSLQSKDFPPEMITEISQQRKQRKMIIGTAQVFSRIAKPIREQTTFIYLPITFAGCLTIVRVTKPQYWDEDRQVFTRYIRTYFFVHNDGIRNSFDTYKKIEKYKKEGFSEKINLRIVE